MQIKANTDTVGGVVVLAIAAFFYVQLGEGFSSYGTYFPERVLPLLAITGVILIARGIRTGKEARKIIFHINWTMLLAMVVGAAWALSLEFVGFLVSSFTSLAVLVLAYMPKEKRTIGSILLNCVGIFAVVFFAYYAFSHWLGVTLPTGKIFVVK